MNFGVILNEPSDVYHATDCVGSHKLADFARSPLLYYRRYVSKEAEMPEKSPAFAFGEYLHALALEGEEVAESRYAVAPEGIDRRTNVGKAAWAEFQEQSAGRIVIKQEDRDLAWRMVESIRAKATCRKLFERGKPEVVFRKQMASFPIQSRCDWFDGEERPTIVDVKSINTLGEFNKQFHAYGYFRQASFYQLVVNAVLGMGDVYPRFVFVVTEKEEPFDVSIREPDENSLDLGRRQVMADLARLKQCYDTNTWPGERDEIRPVSLPEWLIAKNVP